MSEKCARCPCPEICLARPAWCELMAVEAPDALHIRHIINRSKIELGLPTENTPVAYPSPAEMAVNSLKAMGRFLKSGLAVVSQEEHDQRRSICATCEHFDAAQDRCRKCGCYLAVKPWSKAESCPVGKW